MLYTMVIYSMCGLGEGGGGRGMNGKKGFLQIGRGLMYCMQYMSLIPSCHSSQVHNLTKTVWPMVLFNNKKIQKNILQETIFHKALAIFRGCLITASMVPYASLNLLSKQSNISHQNQSFLMKPM